MLRLLFDIHEQSLSDIAGVNDELRSCHINTSMLNAVFAQRSRVQDTAVRAGHELVGQV